MIVLLACTEEVAAPLYAIPVRESEERAVSPLSALVNVTPVRLPRVSVTKEE